MQAEITGIGWVTATGMGRGRAHEGFSMPSGRLSDFNPQDVFQTPYPNLRRMDDYSRLGVTAIALALTDAGLDEWAEKRNVGVIASTVFGCLGADVDYYSTVIPNRGAQASPAIFSYTSANSFLGEAAIRFGLTGTNYTLSENRPTGLVALNAALGHLFSGDDDKILGGVCDAGCPQIFNRSDEFRPGAIFFILESIDTRSRLPFGRLSSDASGTLRLNDNKVQDVAALVKLCLSEISV